MSLEGYRVILINIMEKEAVIPLIQRYIKIIAFNKIKKELVKVLNGI